MTIYKSESWDGTEEVRYFLSYASMMRYHREKDPVYIRLVGIYGYELAPSRNEFLRLMRVKKHVDVFVYCVDDERTGKHKKYCYKVTKIKVI